MGTVLTTIIYPFVVHWGWSGVGFLGYSDDAGESTSIVPGFAYSDFAGSGIVHMVGGVGALIGAVIVGPRKHRFVGSEDFAPHNIPLCVLGTLVLWFGWYGFNGASTLAMKTPADAYTSALVCMNTTLSPSIAAIVVFLLRAKVVAPKCFDVCGICNGILAGLVSITAPCGSVKPWEAVIIGFIGAFVYQGVSMLMQKVKIDDPLDAFAVHGACGLWGVLCNGIFGEGQGLLYGGTDRHPVRGRDHHRPVGHRLVRAHLSPPQGAEVAEGNRCGPRDGSGRARALPTQGVRHGTLEEWHGAECQSR